MSKYEEDIKQHLKQHKIVLYSKTWCGFCHKAKAALEGAGAKDYFVVELDQNENGSSYQDALFKMTKSRTVPQLFINGKYVGGGTEAANLQRLGQLKRMIEGAN